jgi:hypothetical protein
MTRREILSLVGFREQFGALRFEAVSITEEALTAMSEEDFALAVQRWWRRLPALPARETIGDCPDWP